MVSSVTLGNFFNSGGRTVFGGTGGSGLDTQSIVKALTDAKLIPATQAQDRIKANAAQSSALGELQTLVSKLKDAANFLRNPPGVNTQADNIFKYTTASVVTNSTTNPTASYMSVSTSPGAVKQSYTIDEISSLARSKRQATGNFAISSPETSVVSATPGTGQFKAGTFTFKGVNFTFNEGDTLNSVVSKFNAVSTTTGVTASIIKVADNSYQLSFVATQAGTANDFDFNSADLTDPSDVFDLVTITDKQTASDARFKLNGVEIVRSSNSISDAVDGLTFTLFQTTPVTVPATTLTLTVAQDEKLVRDGVVNFVNAYNEFRTFVAKQTEVNDSGGYTATAVLANNSAFRQVVSDITTQVSGISARMLSAGAGGGQIKPAISFSDLPKTADTPLVRNILAVDEGTLTSIISTNPDEVRRAFSFDLISDNTNLQVFSRTNALAVNSFTLKANPYASQTTQTLLVTDADTAFVATSPAAGQLKAGTITINGQAITLADGDSLNTVISKFAAVQASTGVVASLTTVASGQYKLSFASTVASGNNNFNLRSLAVDPSGVFGRVSVTATGTYTATYTRGTDVTTVNFDTSITPYARSQQTSTLTLADVSLGANSPIVFATPAAGQLKAGTFTFKGSSISLSATDSLNTVVQKFNAVSGTTGVRASVIQTESGQYKLSFSSINSDAANDFDFNNSRIAGTLSDPDGVFGQLSAFTTTERKDSVTLRGPAGSALEGLVMLYADGAADTTDVTVTQGFGDRIYNAATNILSQNSGTIAVELASIQSRDDRLNDQIARINLEVERFRQQLLDKFAALEQAISRVNNLLQSITANNDARNNS